jgi:tyrosinase
MTLDDMLNMVFVGEPVLFGDLMSPIEGPFCYIYE